MIGKPSQSGGRKWEAIVARSMIAIIRDFIVILGRWRERGLRYRWQGDVQCRRILECKIEESCLHLLTARTFGASAFLAQRSPIFLQNVISFRKDNRVATC